MTRAGHIASGIVILLGLMLAALWLVPPLLDWRGYRGDVAALATATLGRPVRIEGGVALRLLPQPTLEADRVVVDAGAGATITVATLRLQVALGPLLSGQVDARDLTMRGADIRLPWPIDPSALALRLPSWLSALSARLEDSRLVLGEAVVSGIYATLATGDVSGSFFSSGRAKAAGRDWTFTMRVSRPGGDGAVALNVTLDGQGASQGLGMVMAGQAQPDGTLLGRVSMRGRDLSQVMPAPAVPFRMEGRLSFAGGLLAADELVGDVAGSPVQGAVALRLMPALRLDMALAASRMDLDAWGPALTNAARNGGLGHLPVGIDLSAEAASLAGGVLRGVRGAFDLANGRMAVRELRAILPGDSTLRLEGAIAPTPAGALRFDGKVQLRAPSLRSTMDWALAAWGGGALAADTIPPGALRTAEIETAVMLEDGVATIAGLTGRVDGAALAANLALRGGPRPMVRALLALDRLDLDPWLPAQWPGLSAIAGGPAAWTLDLQLESKTARWRGIDIAPLSIDVAAEPGRLALRRLDAQAGAVSLKGAATVLAGGRVAESRIEVRADRADAILEMARHGALARHMGALRKAPLIIQAQASGAPETLGLKLLAEWGDLRMEFTPTLDIPASRWAGPLALRHPGAPRLADALGAPDTESWLGPGSFALQAALAGQGASLGVESFDIAAGTLRARGAMRWEAGAIPRLTGRIAAETLPLPSLLPVASTPLPVDVLLDWAAELRLEVESLLVDQVPVLTQAGAVIDLNRGRLRLGLEHGRMAGGAFTASAQIDATARPPSVALAAQLDGADASAAPLPILVDSAAGRLDIRLKANAAGFSPVGLLAGLGGDVSLTLRDGTVPGIDLARLLPRLEEANLRAGLSGGITQIATLKLDAAIDRGGLTLRRGQASGPAGRIDATGTIDLTRGLLAVRLGIFPAVEDPPEIGLRLTGPFGRVQRVPELAGATRWRTNHP
jgi:hypothetical protein